MPRALAPIYSLNSGEVSKLALARLDLARMRIAAETCSNWLATVLGPAKFRPGTDYLGTIPNAAGAPPTGFTASDGNVVKLLPFNRGNYDTAVIELTPTRMRVWVNDTLITRPSVTAALTNGGFVDSLTGWTNNSTLGGVAAHASNGANLSAPVQGGAASIYQSVPVVEANTEHALRIVVSRGPVTLEVGSTLGNDDYVTETTLLEGTHSISFTPAAGNFVVQLAAKTVGPRVVRSCTVEAAGILSLPTEWDIVSLRRLQTTQSADVIFCADARRIQRRIERRNPRSWSITKYYGQKGPLNTARRDIKLTPSALTGIATISASGNVFKPGHVESILRMFHAGQQFSVSLGEGGRFTDAIRLSGVGSDRACGVVISGTWTGTLRVQRSFQGPDSGFATFGSAYTGNGTYSFTESSDNAIVWVRVGFPEGADYSSGFANVTLTASLGGGEGYARILSYNSPTQVVADIESSFYYPSSTLDWQLGEWNNIAGWPAGVTLYDGRLWWANSDRFAGSVSDAYDSFDLSVEGDSAPIIRAVGSGPVNTAFWMLPLQRLLIGTSGAEISVRSSAFDSPLTPTDLTARNASTFGCAPLAPGVVDRSGIFVAKDGRTICEIAYSVEAQDYITRDLTQLHPDIMTEDVIDIAVQRQPDTRVWFVLADGTARCLTYERENEVVAWSRIVTDGAIKAICVRPDRIQDRVYWAVNRGSGVYLERMAIDSEARGAAINVNVDSSVRYSGPSTTIITGLSHLNGKPVHVWTSAKVGYGPFTVESGSITLPVAVTSCVVGLSYHGIFKSAKLGFGAVQSPLGQRGRIDRLGISFCDTHHFGISWGCEEDRLDPLPAMVDAEVVPANRVWGQKEIEMEPVNGRWSPDQRFIIKASSPYPATMQGVTISQSKNDAL